MLQNNQDESRRRVKQHRSSEKLRVDCLEMRTARCGNMGEDRAIPEGRPMGYQRGDLWDAAGENNY